MAFLDSRRVTDLELHLPPCGGAFATGHLDSGTLPAAGAATLRIGDLSLEGALLPGRGGADSPARPAFTWAQGNGWTKRMPAAPPLTSPTALRLSVVLATLAAVSGERYDAPPEAVVSRAAGAAMAEWGWPAGARVSALLARLVDASTIPAWRVQANGRTSFTAWPPLPPADAHGVIEDRRLAVGGVRSVALSGSVAAWLPGATVQGVRIARVLLSERNEETRVSTWES